MSVDLLPGYGVCPLCNGSLRCKAKFPDRAHFFSGFNPNDGTLPCYNCAGRGMYGSSEPTGRVPLRPDGTPCAHEYVEQRLGRCYSKYTCKHCRSYYSIDSGD